MYVQQVNGQAGNKCLKFNNNHIFIYEMTLLINFIRYRTYLLIYLPPHHSAPTTSYPRLTEQV